MLKRTVVTMSLLVVLGNGCTKADPEGHIYGIWKSGRGMVIDLYSDHTGLRTGITHHRINMQWKVLKDGRLKLEDDMGTCAVAVADNRFTLPNGEVMIKVIPSAERPKYAGLPEGAEVTPPK